MTDTAAVPNKSMYSDLNLKLKLATRWSETGSNIEKLNEYN